MQRMIPIHTFVVHRVKRPYCYIIDSYDDDEAVFFLCLAVRCSGLPRDSLKLFFALTCTFLKYFVRPVPVVRRRKDFSAQLSVFHTITIHHTVKRKCC